MSDANQQSDQPQRVTPYEILDPLEGKGGQLKLTALQQIGMRLALGVGSLIFVVTVAALIDEYCSRSGLPSPPQNLSSADTKAALDNYKQLNDIVVDRGIKIFESLVVKALLPLFTAILGYIFGSRISSGKD